MKRLTLILISLFLITGVCIPNNVKASYQVLIKNGDIYLKTNNNETRLTHTGLNKSPVLHPSGEWIYFIKTTGANENNGDMDSVDPPIGYKGSYALKEGIWKMKISGKNKSFIYKSLKPPEPNQTWYTLSSIDGIQFSPSGHKIYFQSDPYTVTGTIWVMKSDGSNAQLMSSGYNLKIIKSGTDRNDNKYKGYLIIKQHRYFEFGGSYDWYWLFDPDFKEIGPIGENMPEDLTFFDQTNWNPIVNMKRNKVDKNINKSFKDYKAQIYRGKIHRPKWISNNGEKEWRDDTGKTVEEPKINFAGKYFMTPHSCGQMCSYYTLTDLSTGKDLDLLRRFNNGEDQIINQKEIYSYHTDLFTEPDSNIIVARKCALSWEGEKLNCQESVFLLKGDKLKSITTRDIVRKEETTQNNNSELSPRQIEILQTVLNPDGYISKELHSEFWGLIPFELKDDKQAVDAMVNFMEKNFVLAMQFTRESFASMKASIEAGRIVKTPEYEFARNKFYTSVPQQARQAIQKSIDNSEEMIKAAAETKPFQSNRGTIYITLEMVNQVIAGLDDSFSRASRLMNPEW